METRAHAQTAKVELTVVGNLTRVTTAISALQQDPHVQSVTAVLNQP
jgi:hypothetical protein